MKTRIIKSAFLLIMFSAILTGIKLSFRFINAHYSVTATEQLENDGAYSMMETQGTVEFIVGVVGSVLIFLVLSMFYKVWKSYK